MKCHTDRVKKQIRKYNHYSLQYQKKKLEETKAHHDARCKV